MSHLGSRVSALLDGRLSPEDEERCWSHVHDCHACRDLVENEGWVKTQLAHLSLGPAPVCEDFKSSLAGRCGALTPAPFVTAGHRSRRGLVAISGGAASACVVGVLALGVAGSPRIEPAPPVTDLSGSTTPATPVLDRGPRARRGPSPEPYPFPGRVPTTDPSGERATSRAGTRAPLSERLVAIREKIAP